MRVLHILPPAAGGMLRHVQRLLDGLDPRVWEQYCAAAPGMGLEEIASRAPGRALPLPMADPVSGAGVLVAAVRLARLSSRVRPDLLHGHGYRGMVLAAIAARLARRPFVFTAHNLPTELSPRFWQIAAPLCRGARGAACVSRVVADDLAARLWGTAPEAAPCPVHVVYNGVEVGPAPGPRVPLPPDLDADGRGPVVVTAARLARQKGIATLLDAWALATGALPGGVLVIAGDGPLRADLEGRAGSLGIARQVRFAGFREDVRSLLRAADVAAIPSLVEGQSLFALEAMAEGAPVVASRAGGLAEMVRDGETGLLVPPGDAGALAEALRRVLGEPALALRLAASARAFVAAEMTVERMLERMAAFYAAVGGG